MRNDIIQNNSNSYLKYFYEPKPENDIKSLPDWLGYEVRNTINKDGLNERINYSLEKDANTFRIITLGDSYTFGHNVDTEKNYSEALEVILNNRLVCDQYTHFDVINLGVNGYDIEYPVERFISRGLKYNPDLVVWLINEWNFDRINEYMIPVEENYKSQGVPDFNPSIGGYEAAIKAFADIRSTYGEKFILNYQKKPLQRLSSAFKGKLLLISINKFAPNIQAEIEDFLKLHPDSFSYVLLSKGSLSNDQRLLDGHPNEKGHKIIAEALYNYLKNVAFPDCIEN